MTRLRRPFGEWRALGSCILAAPFVTVAGTVAVTVAACDSGGIECQCEPTGLLLQICPELASQVQSIQTSGEACTPTAQREVDAGADAGNSVDYEIQPSQPGACSVNVAFRTGQTYSSSVPTFDFGAGCCSGLYPNGSRVLQICLDASVPDSEVPSDSPSGS
jgi:hypothetical protein